MQIRFPNLDSTNKIALDIETFDPDIKLLGPGPRRNGYILGVGIATHDKEWYFSLNHKDKENNIPEKKFYSWLNTQMDKIIITANGLYDFDFLQYQGILPRNDVIDVQIAEPLIDENKFKYNLDSLGEIYLDIKKGTDKLQEYCDKYNWKGDPRTHLYKMDSKLVGTYCKKDCRITYDVFMKQYPILKDQELLQAFRVETDLFPLLLHMRKTGVRIDTQKWDALSELYKIEEHNTQKSLNKIAGFDLNVKSSAQVAEVFKNKGLPLNFTDKGNPSYTTGFLKSVNHEVAQKILHVRKLRDMQAKFIDGVRKFIVRGRLHCEFNQMKSDEYGTVTGRFSSSRPNLQQIPKRDEKYKKELRGLFIPEDGYFWLSGDYASVEIRLLAHYAKGPGADDLRAMYNENPYLDMHQVGAELAGITRSQAKSINLGVMYGMGVSKLCQQLGLKEKEGRALLDKYYAKMPFLKRTQKAVSTRATQRGYVFSLLKRRRRFPYVTRTDERTGRVSKDNFSYKALNFLNQGGSADIIKAAMVASWKAGLYSTLVPHLTVHDEIDCSCPDTKEGKEAVKELKHIFENTIKLKVPLVFEIEKGKNWGDTKEYF